MCIRDRRQKRQPAPRWGKVRHFGDWLHVPSTRSAQSGTGWATSEQQANCATDSTAPEQRTAVAVEPAHAHHPV
eukprot:506553-Alexandrium_andersonii.AAC.1